MFDPQEPLEINTLYNLITDSDVSESIRKYRFTYQEEN